MGKGNLTLVVSLGSCRGPWKRGKATIGKARKLDAPRGRVQLRAVIGFLDPEPELEASYLRNRSKPLLVFY